MPSKAKLKGQSSILFVGAHRDDADMHFDITDLKCVQ